MLAEVRLTPGLKPCQIFHGALLRSQPYFDGKGLDAGRGLSPHPHHPPNKQTRARLRAHTRKRVRVGGTLTKTPTQVPKNKMSHICNLTRDLMLSGCTT